MSIIWSSSDTTSFFSILFSNFLCFYSEIHVIKTLTHTHKANHSKYARAYTFLNIKAMMKKYHWFLRMHMYVNFAMNLKKKKSKKYLSTIVFPAENSQQAFGVCACTRCCKRLGRLSKLHVHFIRTFFNWFALYKSTLAFFYFSFSNSFEMIIFFSMRTHTYQYVCVYLFFSMSTTIVSDCFWICLSLSKIIEKNMHKTNT